MQDSIQDVLAISVCITSVGTVLFGLPLLSSTHSFLERKRLWKTVGPLTSPCPVSVVHVTFAFGDVLGIWVHYLCNQRKATTIKLQNLCRTRFSNSPYQPLILSILIFPQSSFSRSLSLDSYKLLGSKLIMHMYKLYTMPPFMACLASCAQSLL